MKKYKTDVECTGCGMEYVVTYKTSEEDIVPSDPTVCAFCGEDILTTNDEDDFNDLDDHWDNEEEEDSGIY